MVDLSLPFPRIVTAAARWTISVFPVLIVVIHEVISKGKITAAFLSTYYRDTSLAKSILQIKTLITSSPWPDGITERF